MIFATTAFKLFIATMRLENQNSIVSLCLAISMPKIFELSSSTSHKSLPMGVNDVDDGDVLLLL
jgi:hypothetical protein